MFVFYSLFAYLYYFCIFFYTDVSVYFIDIFGFWVFMTINPFIYKYMTLCVLKGYLNLECRLPCFFFHGRCRLPCNIRFHYRPYKYSCHVYIRIQKDAYVCRIILRKRVSRKGAKILVVLAFKEEERRDMEGNRLCLLCFELLHLAANHTWFAEVRESSRYRYIFSVFSFLFFSNIFLRGFLGYTKLV